MQRRHDLDWVRVCAFGLLVLYHVGMYYVSWDWHVNSPHAGPALEPLMLASAPWRLSLLFLVSGAATGFLIAGAESRATHARPRFLAARSRFLLLPLLFGMLVVVPPQSYFEVLDSRYPGGYHDGFLAFWARYLRGDGSFCDDDGCLVLPTWNHLWFVAYLWVYTAVLWALWRLGRPWLRRAAAMLGRCLCHPAAVLAWPALYLGLVRAGLAPRFGSTHALADDWYNHAQYFTVFLFGYLIAHQAPVWDAMARARRTALVLWLGCWAVLVAAHVVAGGPPAWLRPILHMAWGLAQWSAIVAVLGFARQWAPGDGPVLRYLVPAVFPVYILHQTAIVLAAWQLRPLALAPAFEGPLLVVLTFASCLGGYELIRRIPVLRPLFGLRRQPAGQRTGNPATTPAEP